MSGRKRFNNGKTKALCVYTVFFLYQFSNQFARCVVVRETTDVRELRGKLCEFITMALPDHATTAVGGGRSSENCLLSNSDGLLSRAVDRVTSGSRVHRGGAERVGGPLGLLGNSIPSEIQCRFLCRIHSPLHTSFFLPPRALRTWRCA